eukprot:scaffold176391_cov31-Tisochrysis_lutea.AAC.2
MYATPALLGAILYSLLRVTVSTDGTATTAAAAVEAAAAAIWDGANDPTQEAKAAEGGLLDLLAWITGSTDPSAPANGADAAAAAAASTTGSAANTAVVSAADATAIASPDLSASLPFDATYFIPWAVCLILRWAAWTWRLALPHWARRRQSFFGDGLRPLGLMPAEPTFTVSLPRNPGGGLRKCTRHQLSRVATAALKRGIAHLMCCGRAA